MRLPLILLAAAALLATPAASQDLLSGFARRAAEAVVGRGAADPQAPGASAPRNPLAPPASSSRRRADDAPEAQGLQGLPEDERERACNQRVPLDPGGGRSYEKQLAFGRCMGPRYGDGG